MTNKLFIAFFLLTLTQFPALANAQSTSEQSSQDFMGLISAMWSQKCPELVTRLVTRKDVELALQSRPIDVAAVCDCSNEGLLADDKLRRQFIGDSETVKMRMQDGLLKPYFTLRMIQSAFVCLSDDIEKSLNAVSFTQ